MVDYREILRLDNLGYTKKDVASSVHSSRNTVSEVLTLAGNLHICWSLDDDVTNQSLECMFYPGRNKDNEERLMPDYPKIHRELAKKRNYSYTSLDGILSGSQCNWEKTVHEHTVQ